MSSGSVVTKNLRRNLQDVKKKRILLCLPDRCSIRVLFQHAVVHVQLVEQSDKTSDVFPLSEAECHGGVHGREEQ